jgi:CO/xanthine dehydrogenase FAD-binding subunit
LPITVETPESVADVVGALGDGAIVLAGGTYVMPWINTEAHDVAALVSLRRAGLADIDVAGGTATIGAATTLARAGADERLAFLRSAIESIASPTIRNLATVGGNLFVEQPYGDLAVALLALDAQVDVAGPAGTATQPVAGVLAGGVPAGHIVTAVRFALPAEGEWRYAKAMRRRLNSASIVTVAAVVRLDGDAVASARIALGGAGRRPVRAPAAEAALAGGPLDRARAEAASAAALEDAEPFTDAYASAWYRARVLPVHVRRALIGE